MHLSPGLHVSHFLFYFDSPSCLVCYIRSCFPCPVSQVLFSCVSRCVHCALIPSCVFIVHVPLVLCCILPFVCSCPDYPRIWLVFALPSYQKPHWDFDFTLVCWVLHCGSTPCPPHAPLHMLYTSNSKNQSKIKLSKNVSSACITFFFNLAWNHNNNSHLISQGTTLNATDCYQEALGNTTEHVTEVDNLNSKEPNNSIHNA